MHNTTTMKRQDERDIGRDGRAGATATFPYDRMTVERFRKSFPRARWDDDLKAWVVPGKTAERRIDRWLEQEAAAADAYADLKGRDAYAFDPIMSKYLILHDDRLEVRTPYSRTVVNEMHEVPFARWDQDRRVWMVPYRSYEALHRRWDQIESAARRNEPEERKQRQAARHGTEKERASRLRAGERRRRRYPLEPDNLPPLGRPVMTATYGIVIFTGIDEEQVEPEILRSSYTDIPEERKYVWGRWRSATLKELVRAWPSRPGSAQETADTVWWQPTIDELRPARKTARSRERRRVRASQSLSYPPEA
jgi:hypothetical protein